MEIRRGLVCQARCQSVQASIPPISSGKPEAIVGVSRDFFDEHVLPELRIVRRGRRRLIPVRELERWLEEEARRALEVEA
jgi:hypothetical protein